ncbi:hypothetical protein [Vulcanococcus limneticus]|jgi:hypothetical protein|uniref:hypothetical protein n=1 Tax=Vulcanococcus limneticus TaxID=2170428 RepID=UPI00398C1FB7
MRRLFLLLLLPLRAPMLLLLAAVSVYLGLHWVDPQAGGLNATHHFAPLFWSAQCAQALLVVVFCCMPDLLLRRFSVMLAASRVVTLVATVLLVTIGGLYLLHLEVFSNVLILAASVLLVRLDLVRIRLAPAPGLLALLLALVVLVGANLGHRLGTAHASDNEGIAPEATGQRAQPQVSNRRRLLLGRVKTQQQRAPQAP